MADEKLLKIKLQYEQDAASLGKTQKSTKEIGDDLDKAKTKADGFSKSTKGIGDSADQAKRKINEMREQAERMQQVGITMAAAGAAILTPMGLALNNYIQNAGEAEQSAKRWKEQQERLSVASQRVGKVIADEALPYLEKAADLAEKAAKFAEEHPEAVKAVGTIGVTLAAAGTLVTGVAQIQRTITSIQSLFGTGGLLAGAGAKVSGIGEGLLGFAGSTAGAVAGGFGIGLAGYQGIANSDYGRQHGFANLQEMATVAAYYVGNLTGKGNEWARAVGLWTHAIEDNKKKVEEAKSAQNTPTTGQLGIYLNYIKSESEAASKYQEQISSIKGNYSAQRAQEAADYARQQDQNSRNFTQNEARTLAEFNRQTAKSAADFSKSEAETEVQYYQNRLESAKTYGLEVQRMEEDHQREMRKLQADHQASLEDLAANRDALGIVREMRSYERSRRDAESQYNLELGRKRSDFARSQAEQEAQFVAQRAQRMADFQAQLTERQQDAEIQRQQRLQDYNQQQADAQAQYNLQRSRAAAAMKQQLADLAKDYNDQRNQRRQALVSQLTDTLDALTQENLLRKQFDAETLARVTSMIRAIEKGTPLPSRASGGYVGAGIYEMHDHEYVLKRDLTLAAERATNGSLTNDKLMALIARGSGAGSVEGGRGSVTWNDHRRFDSSLSAADRRAIRQDTQSVLEEAFG
jgi:hypothetical protein